MTDKIYYRLSPVEEIIDDEVKYIGYSLHLFANPPADWGGRLDSTWAVVDDFPYWTKQKIVEYVIEEDITPAYMKGWFANNNTFMTDESSTTFVGLNKIHTEGCIDMSYLFRNVTTDLLDLSTWDTSLLLDINHIFNLSIVGKLDLSNWDFSNVVDASYAFSDFKGEIEMPTTGFDKVENAEGMFSSTAGYWGNNELDINTLKRLVKLVPGESLKTMRFMFSDSPINKLDLRHWTNVNAVRDYTGALQGMNQLTTILSGADWDLSKSKILDSTMSDTLFYSADKLKGKRGTKYDENKYGKSMALLDTSEHEGYLSYAESSALRYFPSSEQEYTYDGTPKFATLSISTEDGLYEDIKVYYGVDASCSEGPVLIVSASDIIELTKFINAGEYQSYFKIDAIDHDPDYVLDFVRILINKAIISGIISPASISGLEYNKQFQELVVPGTTPVGTMVYMLGSEDYSSEVPKAINAGQYVVRFKVISDDDNYEDYVSSEGIIITISKVDPHFESPQARIIDFNRLEQELISEGYTSEGIFKYSLASEGPFSTVIPTAINAGEYNIYFTIEGDLNHNDLSGGPVIVTINKVDPVYVEPVAYTDLVFNRFTLTLASEGFTSEGVMEYSLSSEGPWLTVVPGAVNAGDYDLYYRIVGDANHNDLGLYILSCRINKADPTLTYPLGLDLTYNTSEQYLISEGESSEGTFRYTLTVDSQGNPINWVTAIPTGINAGEYEVFYKLVGDPNHNDTNPLSIVITIDKADASLHAYTAPISLNLGYAGHLIDLISEGHSDIANFKYTLITDSQGQPISWASEGPKALNAGSYTVYYKLVATDPNYKDSLPFFIAATIIKVDPHYTAPTAKILDFNRLAQELVSEGYTSEGQFMYSLGSEGPFTINIPTAINAGDYKVYFTIIGDSNHNDLGGGPITITINKVDPTYIAPVANTLVFDRSTLTLASEGFTSEGIMWYSLSSEGPWTLTVPGMRNAGDYDLLYKIIGDNNHNNIGFFVVPCKIEKADPTFIAPIGFDLIYNTSEQFLISEGETSEGIFRYTLTTDSQGHPTGWVTIVPSKKNAGDYDVYYEVVGDSNHKNSDPQIITVTIKKADAASYPYLAPRGNNYHYSGSEMVLISEGRSLVADFVYTMDTDSQGQPINWSSDLPEAINTGDYTIYYKLIATDPNYKDSDVLDMIASILKAIPIVTVPIAHDDLVYNNSEHELLRVLATTTGGTMKYSVIIDSEGNKIWVEGNPKLTGNVAKTDTYRIYYKAFGNSEWDDSAEGSITVTIYTMQEKTVYAKKSNQTVNYDTPTFSGLSKVKIINSEGWQYVNDTIIITSEGTDIDIAQYEKVDLRLATELPARMIEKTFVNYTISEGVKKIGRYAFQNADQLTEITIPSWINSIDYEAFNYDVALTTVTYEASSELHYTGKNAFQYDIELTTVNLPDTITTISDSSFEGCKKLATVVLPDTLTKISASAFRNISYNYDTGATTYKFDSQGIQYITLPDGLEWIGSNAFNYTNLESIELPSSITTMGEGVFANCQNLKTVIWPDTLTAIPKTTFSSCIRLPNADWIPDTVTEIGDSAFGSTLALKSANISHVTTFGRDAFYRSGIVEVDLSSATSLGYGVFRGCRSIKKLIIPSNPEITSIPDEFSSTTTNWTGDPNWIDLEYVYIPSNITSIGRSAFKTQYNVKKSDGSTRVLTMVIDCTTPPTIEVQKDGGSNNYNILTFNRSEVQTVASRGWRIYVPDEAYDAYVDPSCNWYFYRDLIHKKSEMPTP